MEIVPFVPPSSKSTENIAAFIEHWRPLVALLPNVKSFDSNRWDMREAGSIQSISNGNAHLGLVFTKLNRQSQRGELRPLEQPLLDIAKAYAIQHFAEQRPTTLTRSRFQIKAWRYIEAELLQRGLTPSTEFLSPDLLNKVNLDMRMKGHAESTTFSLCMVLNSMVKDLQKIGLIGTRFTWKGVAIPPRMNFSRVGNEFEKARKEKLATDHEMQAVGYVFHNANMLRHRYPSAISAILSAQPGRIGEVLTMPVECAFDDERNGKKIFRLRWRPEKGGKPMTKDFSYATNPWIPHIKTALAWLTKISEPARRIAKWYEDNPTKVHLPVRLEHLRSKEWLSLEEAATILQVMVPEKPKKFPFGNRKIPVYRNIVQGDYRPPHLYSVRFEDVERAVLSELPKGFPIYQRSSGLKYSEALCLIREWEFITKNRMDTNSSHTMFKVPTLNQVQNLMDSAFDDFGCTNEDGGSVRLNTHKFRHRWCTRAEEAGIWRAFNNAMSGRLRICQANAYDHMTADHILKIVSEDVKDDGRLFGEILAFTPKEPLYLHEIERQIQELAMLKAIVVTPFGICVNDFVQSPCEYHLDCLNCRNHACIKGLPARTENIRERLALQERALVGARVALQNGDYGVEDHIKNTLEPNVQRLRAIIAILDDPRFKLGTEILLADGPSNHPITTALQIRIKTLKTKDLNTSAEDSALLPSWKSIDLALAENE